MIKILSEDNLLQKKDLNYEEILNTIVDTVKSSNIEITDDKISLSDDIIELNANIRQVECDWTYKLYCYYKFNEDNIDFDITLNLIKAVEELRVSDVVELSNLLQDIQEIMNV